MSKILERLNWRYATKKFDLNKKISKEDLEELLEVLRLSASSYGLQPYKFLIIESDEVREKLRGYSWNQSQVTDASHLIVICNKLKVSDTDIDKHIQNTATYRGLPVSDLENYGNFMKGKLALKDNASMKNWTSKQAYIALGFLLTSCAEKRLDTCPLEGIEPDKYDEVLKLKEKGLEAAMAVAIGYRDINDTYSLLKKVRKPSEELFDVV